MSFFGPANFPILPPLHTLPNHSDLGKFTKDSLIGQPIYFTSGPHTGKTIRMELAEIQKADIGRKYAKVDRRPLDPPPVVLLRIYEVQTGLDGKQTEIEVVYDETHLFGLLCTVDLFPAPEQGPWSTSNFANAGLAPRETHDSHTGTSSTWALSKSNPSTLLHGCDPTGSGSTHDTCQPNRIVPSPGHIVHGSYDSGDSDIMEHSLYGFTFTESSKQTQALVGGTFVQPELIDYQGSKAVFFVFPDLASKIEGTHFLRYRVFDIFSRRRDNMIGITAEANGGTFKVYSSKAFPGLPPSTELTKYLWRWGMKLNVRESERGGRIRK